MGQSGVIEMCALASIVIFLLLHNIPAIQCSESDDSKLAATELKADGLSASEGPETDLPESKETALTEENSEEVTFVKLYQEGVKAYDNELWYACAHKIENSIKEYQIYMRTLTDCRLECENGDRSSKLSNLSSKFESIPLYFKFLEASDCFRRCRDELLVGKPKVTERLENAFERRVPYQYLQFCYFKLDRLKLSASASYTFLLKNPNDTDTIQNIQYYRDKAGVPEEDFQDMEMVPYKEHFIRGQVAYGDLDWHGVIDQMEQCVEEYYLEARRCHVNCQAKDRMKGREFKTGVADLIFSILTCRLDCEEKLSVLYSEPTPLFLQTIFHYLNYAYYMANELDKSVEATASFLLLNETNKVVQENKQLLVRKHGYTDEDFKPRKSLETYVKERKELEDMMDAILKNYRFADINEVPDEDEDDFEYERQEEEPDDWMTRYEKLGMHLIAQAKDLHRDGRFVTDGLLKPEQCEELLFLVEDMTAGPKGSFKFDLHTARKKLEANPDEDFETSLRLFIRAAEVIRHYTQRYMQVEAIYLRHTKIVCWEPSEEKLDCYRQEDGSCLEFNNMSDELFKDAFSTVTYLNTADEDGDFQFLNDQKDVDSSFGVKCGRTVGFKDGDRHTLKVPKKGQRCAMQIDYTIYRSNDETEYRDLIGVLHKIDDVRMANVIKNSEEVLANFKEKGVTVTKKGEDLQGKERFVADGFATEAQCSTMKNMVLELGKAGDGYNGKRSPHTVNELFAGLTLDQVAQYLENEKLTHSGMVSTLALQAFLELSENSRLMVERYFNLTKPLFFDFTHLVCRTAVDESKFDRQDLSHPVHSDNCVLQPDESCSKEYPAFTQRDYSALLYLNDEFEGGEFFFAHANKSEQISLRPKCGRLVGFNAGEYHGVRAVKSGQRCALALWFTHNPNFKELAHVHARKVLKKLLENQQKEEL